MPDTQEQLVILFADIAGSTGLYETMGDARAQQMVSECLRLLIDKTNEAGGELVQTVGDEVMTTFPSADSAFEAAVAMQEAHVDREISIRVGFHYGPVIRKGNNFFGNAVNVAARMASWATAGEIMTTGDTVEVLSPRHRERLRHLDKTTVKGMEEPVAIYEVVWREDDEENLTIMDMGAGASAAEKRLTLVLSYGDLDFRVGEEVSKLTIGRDAGNDLVVNERVASRRHAKVAFTHGKFVLTDESANGTFVVDHNGQTVVLRRETTNLLGSGLIGLGGEPKAGESSTIRYSCLED